MPTIEVGTQTRIHYLEEHPEGRESVLLLHGLGATCDSWRLQTPPLINHGFHVLAPDIPGFGKSSCPPKHKISIASQSDLMAEFLKQKDIQKTHVIGISMGGTIALQLAIDHPNLVDKLVLVNTFAKLQTISPSTLPYFILRLILVHTLGLPAQAKTVAKRLFPNENQESLRQELIAQIVQSDPKCYRATMRAFTRFDVTHKLKGITAPTLVISGDMDNTVPLMVQQDLVSGLHHPKHVIIKGAGHAVTVEKPDEFNTHMMEFLLNAG